MSNTSIEWDSARAILNTYQKAHDKALQQPLIQTKLRQKNQDLAKELDELKEQYLVLQQELVNRDKKLALLNRELVDKTTDMARLREDFEHVIYQITHRNAPEA